MESFFGMEEKSGIVNGRTFRAFSYHRTLIQRHLTHIFTYWSDHEGWYSHARFYKYKARASVMDILRIRKPRSSAHEILASASPLQFITVNSAAWIVWNLRAPFSRASVSLEGTQNCIRSFSAAIASKRIFKYGLMQRAIQVYCLIGSDRIMIANLLRRQWIALR